MGLFYFKSESSSKINLFFNGGFIHQFLLTGNMKNPRLHPSGFFHLSKVGFL